MVTANAPTRLIQHYVDNFRRLPWRSAPGEPAPDVYRVWLSEVMLQQTTVAAVIPRFARFIARWPTIEALAAAGDEDILGEWAGLGYYARARNLIACARQVAARGSFPDSAAALRELPGIGVYTSAAIAAIAFGERAPAVDTNVARVMARLEGIARPGRAHLEQAMARMMAEVHPGDLVQAMMDLGATVCRPKNPLCDRCPLSETCSARASGNPEAFPARATRRARPHRHAVAYWIERDRHVWLVRRPPNGLLGAMPALPDGGWIEQPGRPADTLTTVRHVFTHFSLDLHVVPRAEPFGEGWWQAIDALSGAGLPALYRKAADQVAAGGGLEEGRARP